MHKFNVAGVGKTSKMATCIFPKEYRCVLYKLHICFMLNQEHTKKINRFELTWLHLAKTNAAVADQNLYRPSTSFKLG